MVTWLGRPALTWSAVLQGGAGPGWRTVEGRLSDVGALGALDETAAALAALVAAFERTRAALAVRRAEVLRARDEFRGRLGNTQHPRVLQAWYAATVAARKLEEADGRLQAAIVEARALAVRLGIDPGYAGRSPVTVEPGGPADVTSGVVMEPAELPALWIRAAGARLPVRPRGKGPTHGVLHDDHGRELFDDVLTATGGMLRSGRVPGVRDGIRDDWHPLDQVTREHVEAHAAAILRRPGAPLSATLVINNETCRSRGDYVGCDQVLSGLLPYGVRLTVYVFGDKGFWSAKTYVGTGEGIES